MESHPVPVHQVKARKRPRLPENWKVNKAKISRYSPKQLPTVVKCHHNSSKYQCTTLTLKNLYDFHNTFYKKNTKEYQDALLLKCCTPIKTKRRRHRNLEAPGKSKEFVTKFKILIEKKYVSVCQKFFLGVLNIKKHRVQGIMRKYFETGEVPQESRGGDHRSNLLLNKKKVVCEFIESLQCSEPHYCRGSSRVRKYLPPDLNITKLYRMYKTKVVEPVKDSFFRKIFNTEYNLGFGSPKTDLCSTCLQLDERLKTTTAEDDKKKIVTEKSVHLNRAKAFYEILKTQKPATKIFSFDCQKNLQLPKLPDQISYYSRQMYLYNLTIVEGTSKAKLTKENVFAYTWTENEFSKGSNEIASAIYDRLNNTDLSGITTITLIADGCGGQNKNSIIIAMCCKWLLENQNVKNIHLVYPITGHSYLPSDRVFGNIEREIRKKQVIVDPEEYRQYIRNCALVREMGKDTKVLDWKKAKDDVCKLPGSWHFQFNKCHRYLLRRSKKRGNVLVKGEIYYKTDLGMYKSICKPEKVISMMIPNEIKKGILMKKTKIADVEKLLSTHYGEIWKENPKLKFYVNVIREQQELAAAVAQQNVVIENDDDEILCEAREEPPDIII